MKSAPSVSIPDLLESTLVSHGYRKFDKRHWRQQLSPRIITGITVSELARGGAESHDAEVICSLSDLVIDRIRFLKPDVKLPKFPFPSFTQKLTSSFPDGELWNPSYPRGGDGRPILARFAALLDVHVLPFFKRHSTPETALGLFLEPGGAAAFEVEVSSSIAKEGLSKVETLVRKCSKQYGVTASHRDSFFARIRTMTDQDLSAIVAPFRKAD